MPLPHASLLTMLSTPRLFSAVFGLLFALLGAGCSTQQLLSAVAPYKVDVIQGNFVSSEMVASLKPGMTKEQVADLLGTPLVVSVFHQDRWDYAFTLLKQGVEPQSRRMTVFFKGNLMERFEGDPMPSEKEFVDTIYSRPFLTSVPKLELTEQEKQALNSGTPATP